MNHTDESQRNRFMEDTAGIFNGFNFPPPPPLPSSADLFSDQEAGQVFNFLDAFASDAVDPFASFQQSQPQQEQQQQNGNYGSGSGTNEFFGGGQRWELSGPFDSQGYHHPPQQRQQQQHYAQPSYTAEHPASDFMGHVNHHQYLSLPTSPTTANTPATQGGGGKEVQPKALLSTPQKRLNHIMSEQKRRNAIRDAYAQLIHLLGDPAGAMPTRGRPKGRAGKNTKGKSGVLFRAVEYIKWLEVNRDALKEEVERRGG
ncbi:hypothetical protein CYLTODRAFT_405249 [Cylindrobasidium torrendii FP15055 ss-10]|uniref:BHLH domain-containing protein n=1 Tax=Cylindrobasidium torrendii FP15055 ss-10 TaxID=1314674 RepID=A0A0D7ATU2_9AGAR|nr:hypothetical protein CYLTODRAFT_405249 [Cylindrobasidium torrendii FP15055 ss-10]